MVKNDIKTQDDIKVLVDKFYEKVVADKLIGFIFTDIAKVDWESHLPKMYSFWSAIIFATHPFDGNPMGKHIELDKKVQLNEEHFNRWMEVWEATVRENFEGQNADEAVGRAGNIASVMAYKVQNSRSV